MSTKSKEWQEFKRVREDILSEYTTSDAGAIRKKWAKDCLESLGYNHEFDMLRCKERTEEDKAALYAEWTQMFKDGKFNPDKKTTTKKKTKPKRGSSLDDLTLDDNPEDASPDVEVNKPSKVDKIVDQMCKEMPDRVELTEQEQWEALPVEESARINIEKQKPKQKPKPKEDKAMPKSKKELLLEAISALEEEESTGITEEQVEAIAKRVAVKALTDLFSEVSETITSTLSSYVEDTENQ